ncbi:MAG: hypothetical protein U0271_24770 [Polyangiaceae bacterium]
MNDSFRSWVGAGLLVVSLGGCTNNAASSTSSTSSAGAKSTTSAAKASASAPGKPSASAAVATTASAQPSAAKVEAPPAAPTVKSSDLKTLGVVDKTFEIALYPQGVVFSGLDATSRIPLEGGAALSLSKVAGTSLVADASDLFTDTFEPGGKRGITKIAGDPNGNGAPTVLATSPADTHGLTVDADRVYWLAGASDKEPTSGVYSVAKSGGDISTLTTGLLNPFGLTSDESALYFCEGAEAKRRVVSVPKAGGELKVLQSNLKDCPSLIVDDEAVYVSEVMVKDDGSGPIWRVPKTSGTPTVVWESTINACFGRRGKEVYAITNCGNAAGELIQLAPTRKRLVTIERIAFSLRVDATHAYWLELQTLGGTSNDLKRFQL